MNLLPVPFAAMQALELSAGDGLGTSGTRTLIGLAVVLAVLALTIWIGTLMGRGSST
jgi:hypothetical protein